MMSAALMVSVIVLLVPVTVPPDGSVPLAKSKVVRMNAKDVVPVERMGNVAATLDGQVPIVLLA
jgi:hypothetical protein